MEGGAAMKGGWMDLTHLGSSLAMSVHGCWLLFVSSRLRSQAQVVSWALIICAWGSLLSVLSFVVAVAVLGAGLSFVGTTLLFVGGGGHPQVVYVVHTGGLMNTTHHCLDDVAHLPHHLCYPHSCTHL